jgi:hypothetical protein
VAYLLISTPDDFDFLSIPQIRNDPGIDIATEMVWCDADEGATRIVFDAPGQDFDGAALHPRGQLSVVQAIPGDQPVPEPGVLAVFGLGMFFLGVARRRDRR